MSAKRKEATPPREPENRKENRMKRTLPEAAKPYQFRPGQSGNPGGRPKRKPITEIYEEILDDPELRDAVKQQIIKTMTTKGMAGVLERRGAAERTEGKVVQQVGMEVSGKITLGQVLEAKKRAGK